MQLPPGAVRGLEALDEHRPLDPDDLVPTVTPFVDYFRRSAAANQQKIREELEPKYFGRLRGYATQIASRAVQAASVEDVERGLAASALEGGRYDYRYTLMTLCLLHHSAERLGANPAGLFQKAAAFGTETAKHLLLTYLATGDKRLAAMGYQEGFGENGQFKYVIATT